MNLSIVIPTLNEEKCLSRLLESIKKQDFRDYEIIVADAGSKDKTLEIAKNFGCKITKGGLPAKGRNEGAKIAKGDLILFLDADTMLVENSLKDFLREFKERELDIATCGLQPFGESWFLRFLYDFFHNFPVLFLGKIFRYGTAFFLVKRELHEKIGGFNEDIKLLEDTVYVRKASKFGKFGMLKSAKIYFSQRRFEKRGWIKTGLKIIFAYFYTIFIGPIKSDIFKYKFGHQDENKVK